MSEMNQMGTQPLDEDEEEKLYYQGLQKQLDDRSLADCFCCLFFIVYLLALVAGLIYGMGSGSIEQAYYPMDEFGNVCGQNNTKWVEQGVKNFTEWGTSHSDALLGNTANYKINVTDRPTLFFYDFFKSSKGEIADPFGMGRCVKTCPTQVTPILISSSFTTNDTLFNGYFYAENSIDVHFLKTYHQISVIVLYPSYAVMGRCIPDLAGELGAAVTAMADTMISMMSKNSASTIYKDVVQTCGPILLASVFFSVIFCLIWIFLLRCCTGLFVWVTVIGVVGGLGFLSYIYLDKGFGIVNPDKYVEEMSTRTLSQIIGVTLTVITVILFLLVFFLECCARALTHSISVIEGACDVLFNVKRLLFLPVFIVILDVLSLAFTGYALLLLGTPTNAMNYLAGRRDFYYSTILRIFLGVEFVGMIWLLCFNAALYSMTTAGVAVAATLGGAELVGKFSVVSHSLFRSLKYNLGSLAFGSFILAIIIIIRLLVLYVRYKLKEVTNQSEQVKKLTEAALCCIECCLAIVEKIYRYISKNAYIMIAIKGGSFCGSAMEGFSLIVENAAKATAVNFIGDFLLFLGKIAVAAMNGLVLYFYCNNLPKESTVTYWQIVSLIAALIGFAVAVLVMGLLENIVDATFLTWCWFQRLEKSEAELQKVQQNCQFVFDGPDMSQEAGKITVESMQYGVPPQRFN
eukprot:TRINITY_DN2375_c0_g1_i1.p1 TRINITY_DN2375_c0_g1~~TRINITY_DN2375_c0_g1_i1.p1  ORF type:complete len:697 (+),score=145.98 TRINITY_DN2375_c0_g1_i1:28-2091(+)